MPKSQWPEAQLQGKRFLNLPAEKAYSKADFQRQFFPRAMAMMGKSRRNPFTGEVSLQDIWDIPDFFVVDLLERNSLPQEVQDLAEDPYLFRPVPLHYRTWFYHGIWKRREKCTLEVEGSAKHEHEMMVHTLALTGVDAMVSAGRHSPMPFFAAGALLATLAGDKILTAVALFMFHLMYVAALGTNTPKFHRLERVITLPIRIGYLIWALQSLVQALQSGNALGTVGWLPTAILPVVDFCTGDFSILTNWKYRCSHNVLRILPSRVYVCQRVGAEFQDARFGSRGTVPECVAGFKNWKSCHTLVADISGLICELRPMSTEEWMQMSEEWSMGGGTPLPYVGLDTFARDEDDGVVKPTGVVHDLAMALQSSSWSSPRRGKEGPALVVEDMDGHT